MIVGILFTALPLVLFVAVCFGYYYTSLKLTDRLIDTLYLLLLWFVIEAAFVRGLGVAARRLAYARPWRNGRTRRRKASTARPTSRSRPSASSRSTSNRCG